MNNKNHLSAIMDEAQEELRELGRHARLYSYTCPVTGERLSPDMAVWVTANGLGSLMQEGVKIFEERTEHRLPRNLIFAQMGGALNFGSAPFRYGGMWCSREGVDRLLKEYGRYRGWLKAAAELPAVKKALMKGLSGNGVNSPYTRFDLGSLIKKYPSPHRLERQLWKARSRADSMLAAWPGERRFASWAKLVRGLILTDKKVGKAAIIAVAETLRGDKYDWFQSYLSARDWLVQMRTANFPVADASDGVGGRRQVEPLWARHGISIFLLRVEDGDRLVLKYLVRRDTSGRTYHAEAWGAGQLNEREFRSVVLQAISAWRRQDEILKQEADLVGFLRGEQGFCPVVVREHSYLAGNCSAGTEAWAQRHGFSDRHWIPGTWLVPHLGDEQVRRVAYACREAFVREGLLE